MTESTTGMEGEHLFVIKDLDNDIYFVGNDV